MIEVAAWVITAVFAVFAVGIGWVNRGAAGRSFSHFAIAGTGLPLVVIAFTDLSTIMGAGNFVGEAEEGHQVGYSQLAFVLGEQGAKIAFALLFAGFAGRFAYRTLAEMMHDLLLRDPIARLIVALLTLALMMSWIGGQGLGMGLLFEVFTGTDPTLIILLFTAIFIAYAALGGMHAVAKVEFVLGILIVVVGLVYYLSAFSLVDFDPRQLNTRLDAAGLHELTSFHLGWETVTLFLTGLLGVLGAQSYWQRCFAAESGRSARTGMLVAGVIATVFICGTVLVGMISRALNPGGPGGEAMPWVMLNQVPAVITIAVFGLVLVAANGAAAANLNAATVIMVNDVLTAGGRQMSDRAMVRAGRGLTVVIGIGGALTAMYASSIIGLFAQAYTLLACSVVPVLAVGLLWRRDRSRPFTAGEHNCRITPWGARTGLVVGAVTGQVAGLYVGFAAAAVLTVVVSLATRDRAAPGRSDADAATVPA
ncbi:MULTISPECIES: sodium:solute symporter family protein [Thermomonosporaceae]|uniref:sodium:solute symporter family protein n=1 Tax=Thermomonosporaceae TaxID=2012 RepID=UPI00255AB970|nr:MULTISPECIES: sodium:solute symporter family protein [Thermomonosporaceae]MDL4775425.1 sodium:solute symporter family protein [Actinomadura xylanilytica]